VTDRTIQAILNDIKSHLYRDSGTLEKLQLNRILKELRRHLEIRKYQRIGALQIIGSGAIVAVLWADEEFYTYTQKVPPDVNFVEYYPLLKITAASVENKYKDVAFKYFIAVDDSTHKTDVVDKYVRIADEMVRSRLKELVLPDRPLVHIVEASTVGHYMALHKPGHGPESRDPYNILESYRPERWAIVRDKHANSWLCTKYFYMYTQHPLEDLCLTLMLAGFTKGQAEMILSGLADPNEVESWIAEAALRM